MEGAAVTVDRQLPLEPTERIDPTTQVERMPGCDAICECVRDECLWPFCELPPTREDE